MEQFTPSEYVALCWYIKSGDCYGELYYDNKTTTIPFVGRQYGFYNSGEQVSFSTHGSHRVPAETAQIKYIKSNSLPIPENDFAYYTSYDNYLVIAPYNSNSKVTVYKYFDGTTTHYFKEPTEAGNHS